MPKKMTKGEKAAFSAGCKVGARNAKKTCVCKKTSYKRSK